MRQNSCCNRPLKKNQTFAASILEPMLICQTSRVLKREPEDYGITTMPKVVSNLESSNCSCHCTFRRETELYFEKNFNSVTKIQTSRQTANEFLQRFEILKKNSTNFTMTTSSDLNLRNLATKLPQRQSFPAEIVAVNHRRRRKTNDLLSAALPPLSSLVFFLQSVIMTVSGES